MAVNLAQQLRTVGSPALLGGCVQGGLPVPVVAARPPFGNGPISLPGHDLIDTDLGGHIDGLLVPAALGQGLNKNHCLLGRCLTADSGDLH